jgi:diguanylate cyclase (GGDEF)-like protein/PAS domain S-box-containing protein
MWLNIGPKCWLSLSAKSTNKTLRAFVESFPGGISVFDARLRLVAHNQNLKSLLDLPDTLFEKPDLSFEDFIRFNVERGDYGEYGPGDSKTMVFEIVERARKLQQHQFQRVRPNGMVLEIRGVPLPDGGFSTTYMDVTKREQAAQRLRIAATAFESQEGMLITDAGRNILKVNQAFSEITGYSAEEAVGRTPGILKSGRHGAPFYQEMADSLIRQGRWQGEIWNRRKSGEIYPEWLMVTAVKDDGGNVTHYVGALTDITSRKSAENEIRTLAFHDALTQLPNRRLLSDRLSQSIAASKRSGRYGAVMFLDLDNFKPINDIHGHEVGDLLLIEAARRLRCAVREMDTVARFGGDEFVVILSELNASTAESVATAKCVAEKICTVLSAPYQLKIQREGRADSMVEHCCTVSLGIAMFLNQDVGRNEILKSADQAMYEAKEAGGNAIRFHHISDQQK